MQKEQYKQASEELTRQSSQLVLYNDDVNTFDHVIECLISICNHNQLQAEQCALLVHFKGKASVKNGSYEELFSRYTSLSNRDLTVEICN